MAALSVTVAQAQLAHEKIGEFEGGLSTPIGLAVNQATGHVYVGNYESASVVEFDEAGTIVRTLTEGKVPFANGRKSPAVDNDPSSPSAGDLYVPDPGNHVVDKFTSEGVFICQLNTEGEAGCPSNTLSPGAFASPEGVAVNPSNGNVYVDDAGNNVIEVFSPTGVFLNQITAGNSLPLQGSIAIAVDSHGNVYAATQGLGVEFAAVRFTPSSETVTNTTTWTETEWEVVNYTTSLATDAEDHVYTGNLGNGEPVTERTTTKELVSIFAGEVIVGDGLGVNNTTHHIYYSETNGNKVFVYNTVIEPTVVTGPATAITHTTAKVEGTVNPEELTIATCAFKYGAGQTAPCNLSGAEIGTGNAPVTVSAELTGLEPGTKYPYRLVVESEGNEVKGAEAEFETPGLATVTTEPPTSVTPTSATLNGTLTPLVSAEVEYFIEYGKALPENQTPAGHFTGENTPHPVAEAVTGLEPSTVYQYQLVAVVEGHTIRQGEPQTFETLPVATATTEAATSITSETATLNGKVNVLEGTANYYFAYIHEGLEERTPELPLTLGEHSVTANVTGLTPNTQYLFHLVVIPSNPSTPIEANVETFTTKVALPVISNETSSHEERHSARLGGEVNPENAETTYYFEYATAQKFEETGGSYIGFTPAGTIPASASPVPVGPVTLSELEPGTEYHYRLVAVNAGGTTHGVDGTFKTKTPLLPSVTLMSPSVTSPTSATLGAQVELNGLSATYTLETGSEVNAAGMPIYSTPTFGSVTEDGALSFSLTNLLPSTHYYFRIVVRNTDGTSEGAGVFETGGFPPVILIPPPVQIVPTPPQPKEEKVVVHRPTKLEKALALCHKKPKKQRAACIRRAHKKYGPKPKRHKKK